MIIMIFNFTDYLTDLPSSFTQIGETASSCYTYVYSTEQTSSPGNKNTPNTVNGFYSSNSLVPVQQSGPVCVVPNKGLGLVLNNGKNLSNKSSGCPLVLYTCNVTKTETELSTPVSKNIKLPQGTYNKSKDVLVGGTVLERSSELPFSGAQCFYNKDLDSTDYLVTKVPSTVTVSSSHQNNGNQSLTHYTGASVPAHIQPVIYSDGSSEKTVLTLANLMKTMPDVKYIVQGKSFQPAAYMYMYVGKNNMNATSLHPPNSSSFGVLSSHGPKLVNSEACGQLPVNDIGYKCPMCSVRFNSDSDRSLHIHKMHGKKCPYCTEVFSSTSGRCYRSLLKHVVLCHKDKDPCSVAHKSTIESALRGASPGYFRCCHCVEEFDSLRGCLEHRVYSHMVTECWICQKTFSNVQKMRIHLKTHTGEKPYVCKFCSRSFSNSTLLGRHVRMHTGNVLHCEQCSFTTVSKFQLEIHVNKHTGVKPYKCRYCSMAYADPSRHKIHERSHTGEKPYACDQCDKAFVDKYSLVRHIRTHTGEKPYKCSYCSKAFAQGCQLQFHERTHTGEKPYECSQCQKKFSRRQELNKHMVTHEKTKQNTGTKRKMIDNDSDSDDSDCDYADEMKSVREEDRAERLASLRSAHN